MIFGWCLFHIKNATRRWAHEQIQGDEFFSKDQKCAIVTRIAEPVRISKTITELDANLLVVRTALGSQNLSADMVAMEVIQSVPTEGGRHSVVFVVGEASFNILLPGEDFDVTGMPLATAVNPLFNPKSLAYL